MIHRSKEQYPAPLQLDLSMVLKQRGIRIPTPVVRIMQRIVRQDDLNTILRTAFPYAGAAFAESAMQQLRITLEVEGLDHVPPGRHIFASNHPLGGLDGIALISVLGEKYGDDEIAFLVNEMLMSVRPLQSVFLPINKYGVQGRRAAEDINTAYASDKQIVIFPAGLVSRLNKDNQIRDLKWQKAFVAKAAEYNRDIIPVHFHGTNSRRFYHIARWRKRLGIKFNIEQILLPSEVIRARGSHFRIQFLPPVNVDDLLRQYGNPTAAAAALHSRLYTKEH